MGKASDLLRAIMLLETGGIYLDNDVTFTKWDEEWLYYFDSILFRETIAGYPKLRTP